MPVAQEACFLVRAPRVKAFLLQGPPCLSQFLHLLGTIRILSLYVPWAPCPPNPPAGPSLPLCLGDSRLHLCLGGAGDGEGDGSPAGLREEANMLPVEAVL